MNAIEEVKNRKIRYLPDLYIVNLLSVYVLVRRIWKYYPSYATHRLYFGEVETPYLRGLSLGPPYMSQLSVCCTQISDGSVVSYSYSGYISNAVVLKLITAVAVAVIA